MGSDVLVCNNDTKDYEEKWEGMDVTVPAGGSIKMKRREAKMFLGSYSGWDKEKGEMKPKMLVIKDYNPEEPKKKFLSTRTGEEFETQAELDKHLEGYKEETITNEAVEDRLKDRK